MEVEHGVGWRNLGTDGTLAPYFLRKDEKQRRLDADKRMWQQKFWLPSLKVSFSKGNCFYYLLQTTVFSFLNDFNE